MTEPVLQVPDDKLFRLLADRVQDYAIFLLDVRGHVISWNAGARLIKQYTAEDIIGKHFSTFYTAEDIARKWPDIELQRALTEGRFQDEGWRVRKDGSRFWANVIITALRDDSGQLLAFSKITRDMTERKAQDEALRHSEERFRLLVDGVADYAIYMLSPDGMVSSWNLGARRIKGYEAGEVLGKHFSRFFTAEDIQHGKPWTELALARERGHAEDEGWRVRRDGSKFWAKVVITPLYDGTGKLRGYGKVTQDLTQRKHSDALEASAKSINDFIAVLAHELRNPLAPIRNAVHLLKFGTHDDADREKIVQVIDRQSGQLGRIVDDILDISRITRGTLELNKVPLPVSEFVSRALEAARPGIESGKHILNVDLSVNPIVQGDDVRLTQALTNILNNAARYSEDGSRIWVKVSEEVTDTGREAVISVRDTGRGIDPQFLSAIFGMFIQGQDPLNRAGTGMGVGLALARSIVELHHGTIEAVSEGLGKGSEFIIRMPAEARPAPAIQDTLHAAPPAVTKRRILVVDDNVDAAHVLASLLMKYGHDVRTAHDGQAAIALSETFQPEFILLDLGMPGMSGLEVARRVRQRKRTPEPLIIAVTGWGKPDDVLRSHDAGFDLHLVKPVEEAQLVQALQQSFKKLH
jgi:PAS domain S-box-containing protein